LFNVFTLLKYFLESFNYTSFLIWGRMWVLYANYLPPIYSFINFLTITWFPWRSTTL
jgi:hypothetical protein